MWGISGRPVNPPICVITIAALASSGWVADLPYTLSFYKQRRIIISQIVKLRLWTIESCLFLPFDLDDFRVMNDDFHRAEPDAFERVQNRLLNRTINRRPGSVLS